MAYTPPSHPPSHLHPPLQHPQRLLFNAATLDDANTLSHYGISREATLTLLEIVRPRVTKICGWAGWFLDRVELFMDDGSSAHYGEVGGEAKPAFDLQEGEWITEVEGRNHGQYQGGGVTFTTNLGRQYEAKGSHFLPTFLGVAPLSDSVTFTAPPGQAIVGLVPCSARGGGFKGAVFEHTRASWGSLRDWAGEAAGHMGGLDAAPDAASAVTILSSMLSMLEDGGGDAVAVLPKDDFLAAVKRLKERLGEAWSKDDARSVGQCLKAYMSVGKS